MHLHPSGDPAVEFLGRPARAVIAFAISVVLSGAGASADTQPPAPKEVARGAEVSVEGTYIHPVTRLEIPEAVGPFSRRAVQHWDREGFNVSGRYYLGDPPRALATVYHYPVNPDLVADPAEKALAMHFQVVRQDIARERPELAFVAEAPYSVPINGFVYRGLEAVYEAPRFQRFDEPVRSTAYLFLIGKWYLKFRFTYPSRLASELDPLQREFISAFIPAPPATSSEPEPLCERLADSYALYAKVRDSGMSRDATLAMAEDGKGPPAGEQARRVIAHAIQFAFENPNKDPSEIRAAVLGDCALDRDGKPELRTLWSWRK
jgi:hypothetical protein